MARQRWGRRIEFFLTAVGYSVGVGDLWRFPYLVMKNGGGKYMLIYIVYGVKEHYKTHILNAFSVLFMAKVSNIFTPDRIFMTLTFTETRFVLTYRSLFIIFIKNIVLQLFPIKLDSMFEYMNI